MTGHIASLWQSNFLRHNAVFFVGSVVVGVLNYAYYPVIGRLLQPSAFGEVQTLISIFLQLGIFLTVLGMVTVNIVANYDDGDRRNQVIFELEKITFMVSLVLLAAAAIFSPQLKSFFRFEDAWPFIILMLTLVVSVPFTFRNAFVRSKKRFGLAALSNILATVAKIVFSVLLIVLGFGTAGAMWGVVIAQFLAFCYIGWWARQLGLVGTHRLMRRPDFSLLAPELKYAGLVLVGSLIITLLLSIDILVVKHYFDAHTAGLYAGIATVARIVFFVTGSISQVMISSVKVKNAAAKNRQLFVKSMVLLAAGGVPVLVCFALFPEWIMRLLMGGDYTTYAWLLPPLGLAIFLISVINLFVTYYMALRRYGLAAVVIIGAVVTYWLMVANHGSLQAVVTNLLAGSVIMLGLLGLWRGWYQLRRGGESGGA